MWPLHLTTSSSIQPKKLSQLNTFLWFLQKHNILEYQISGISSHDLLRNFFRSRWSCSPINLIELLALDWPFYNFKSFKPNRSAGPFRRKVLVFLKTLIKAFYLAQWLDPPLAALFLKIFLLATKTSLLALLLPKAITPPLYHMLQFSLLLCQLF